MKVIQLIELLNRYDNDTIVTIWDYDEQTCCPITGALVSYQENATTVIQLCSDTMQE